MKRFDEYYLIAPGSDYGEAMWSDINLLENAKVFDNPLKTKNKVLKFLHHFHFSFKINAYFRLPFQNIWEGSYSLDKIEFNNQKKYCIIFTDISAGRTGTRYLKKISKLKNIELILVFVNTVASKEKILEDRLKYFKHIFSFDKKDCEKYHFIYHPAIYSLKLKNKNINIKSDAFFVGVAKDRQFLLEKLYQKMIDKKILPEFYIVGVKNKNISTITYNRWLTYKEVLENIKKTNCIIEIMGANQTGITLRTMEAICFNKRLLTNNSSVKELKFYKSGFIQVFENIEDIDMEFIKNRDPVNYFYNNEFSPIHLIEHIDKVFEEN